MRYVLDSSVFINSTFLSISESDEHYTSESVVGEVKDISSRMLLQTALESGRIRKHIPLDSAIARVRGMAGNVGSQRRLSRTDTELLAMALELNATLVTDDYEMQNLASHLGISFKGVVRGQISGRKRF